MSIVDLDQIAQTVPSQVTPIWPPGGTAVGPITASVAGQRTTLFDPLWGYFIFGQSVSLDYNDADVYQDHATFIMQGVFTREAVTGTKIRGDEVTSDAAFLAMTNAYENLRSTLEAAVNAAAPVNYTQWGTANDPRAIVLPLPLVDKRGARVYGLAQSIAITKTQFPSLIEYRAVLREALPPIAKLTVNGIVIDNGVVVIACPYPELVRHPLIAAHGEVLQVKHYKTMELEVRGSVPVHEPGHPMGTPGENIISSCTDGLIDLAAVTKQGAIPAFTNLDLDAGSLEVTYTEEAAEVSFRARK